MKTAVMTCLYPTAKVFVPEFVASLANQTCKDFVLLVINDGVEHYRTLFEHAPFETHFVHSQGTPAKLRKDGIAWAELNQFHIIIFADIDDCFEANRVEHSRNLLQDNQIIFNQLLLFGSDIVGFEPMLTGRFSDGESIHLHSVMRFNCLGLSNTSAYVDIVAKAALVTPDDVIAFDWALFSRVLNSGVHAVYTSRTNTYYRQHGANIAGPWALSDNEILRGVAVKAKHYLAVQDLGAIYENLASTFAELATRLRNDTSFSERYCLAVREHAPQKPLWWESIRTPEELCL